MYICLICKNYKSKKLLSLSIHCKRQHKKQAKELRLLLFHSGITPTCKCGCGGEVKFLSLQRGFTEYIRGHAARVNNNWGHNKRAQEKSLRSRQGMIEDGTWKPFALKETGKTWNAGLTKETDERVRRVAEEFHNDPEEIKKRSERMKKNRLNGIIPTQYGKNHPQWNGGVSSVAAHCYSHNKLYNGWKYPILVAANFKCQNCEKAGPGLHIHHDKEKMNDIIRKQLISNSINLDSLYVGHESIPEKLKTFIAEIVTDYHINNNVSGIVLCDICHKKEHAKLNF